MSGLNTFSKATAIGVSQVRFPVLEKDFSDKEGLSSEI